MRVFVGIEFNEETKQYLYKMQEEVKKCATKGNFTLYDNFHLTLRFIGEVNQSQIDEIEESLEQVVKEHKPFSIEIGGLNSFNRKNKHIVFVEVQKNDEPLKQLAKAINQNLQELELKLDEYRFKPHITLGREIEFSQASVLEPLKNYDKPIMVDQISLMLSSRDKNNTLRYTPLFTVNLG